MPHKFDTRLKDSLLTEEREQALRPEELLRGLGLTKGDTMADIGCGPGFFTIPAARIVGPEGRVLAADIQGEMLSAVRSRANQEGLENVRVVKSGEHGVPLPPASCDLVLVAFTLNEISERATFLLSLGKIVKPDGQIAVIEWEQDAPEGPPAAYRITPEELQADAEAAGLTRGTRKSVSPQAYMSVFTPAAVKAP